MDGFTAVLVTVFFGVMVFVAVLLIFEFVDSWLGLGWLDDD